MRIVVVGLGVQGRKRRTIAGDQVVAAVDPVAPSANYTAIEQVPLADYDAACVCVPDGAKTPILRYLLTHKKHLLVEKPLLAPAGQIQEMLELSRSNRTACYTAYNHRFEPHIARLKQVLDSGKLGTVYLVRMFYGNGTARDVRNSPWRDHGPGVVSDLGSHLLDTVLFLFGAPREAGQIWSVNRFENLAPDHVHFGYAGRPAIELEATMVSWRNTFGLDVYAERGSAHIGCLCKWGPSTLTVRERVFPSGRPKETVETLDQPDPTWKLEYDHFVGLCPQGGSNLENDLWIGGQIQHLAKLAGIPVTG
jgi:scyllo-inositol 2-dehydrogenase (NADP+)